MKTQISRWTDDPKKRRSGIYQQQGRMITDADMNELMELLKRRIDEALGDVVGSGAPRVAGLPIIDAGPVIRPAPIYVDGLRVHLEPHATAADPTKFALNEQADFPSPPWPFPTGDQIIYADVWDLSISALQEGSLLDPGLHGADTCTRTQTLAQVKWCPAAIDPITSPKNPPKGNAPLAIEIRAGTSSPDPCDPCTAEISLENRVGNYLFRVEVHDVRGGADTATEITLKWSSENGAEQHAQDSVPAAFKHGDWIYEFYNDTTEKHLGVHLHLAASFAPQRALLRDGWAAAGDAALDKGKYPYVRRWDGYAVLAKSGGIWAMKVVSPALQAKDKGIALSALGVGAPPVHGNFTFSGTNFVAYLSGLKLTLTLTGKKFVAGDYWLATVRENADDAARVELASELPIGIEHHYLVLARLNAGSTQPDDAEARRRQLSFPPLSNLDADHVGYSAKGTAARWTDILDSGAMPPLPLTVQGAIDTLIDKFESGDIGFKLPVLEAAKKRIRELVWPTDPSSPLTVESALGTLLCELDSSKIPYDVNGSKTLKDRIESLDAINKVNRSGKDTMTGPLTIAPLGLFNGQLEDSLTVVGGGGGGRDHQPGSAGIHATGGTNGPDGGGAGVTAKGGGGGTRDGGAGVNATGGIGGFSNGGAGGIVTGGNALGGGGAGLIVTGGNGGGSSVPANGGPGLIVTGGTGKIRNSSQQLIDAPAVAIEVRSGAIVPTAGNSENAGIMFPKDPGGGAFDAAWMRYYPRINESMTLEIGISNEADDHIVLMPSGNVGIGTSAAPTEKLEVSGIVKATGLNVDGTSILNGNVGIGTSVPANDMRLDVAGNLKAAGLEIPGLLTASSGNVTIKSGATASGQLNIEGGIRVGGGSTIRKIQFGKTAVLYSDNGSAKSKVFFFGEEFASTPIIIATQAATSPKGALCVPAVIEFGESEFNYVDPKKGFWLGAKVIKEKQAGVNDAGFVLIDWVAIG